MDAFSLLFRLPSVWEDESATEVVFAGGQAPQRHSRGGNENRSRGGILPTSRAKMLQNVLKFDRIRHFKSGNFVVLYTNTSHQGQIMWTGNPF